MAPPRPTRLTGQHLNTFNQTQQPIQRPNIFSQQPQQYQAQRPQLRPQQIQPQGPQQINQIPPQMQTQRPQVAQSQRPLQQQPYQRPPKYSPRIYNLLFASRPQIPQVQQPQGQLQQYVQQFQQLQQKPQLQPPSLGPQIQQQTQPQAQPQAQQQTDHQQQAQLQQPLQLTQQQQQMIYPQLGTYRGPQIPPHQVLVQNTIKPLTQNQIEANQRQQANAQQQLQNKQNEANKVKDGKNQNKDEGGKSKKKGLPRQGGGDKWFDPTLDEWPENDFRIFVGDLGNEVNDDGLTRAFQKYKTFQKAKVVKDKRTGKTKGYGFLSFGDVDDYVLAIKEMNGKYIGNRPCKLVKSSWRDRMDQERMQKMNKKRKSNHIM